MRPASSPAGREIRSLLEKLAMVGLAAYLDQVVTQTTTSLRALDKSESLSDTARRAEVDPRACMYVGDEPRDIMAAMGRVSAPRLRSRPAPRVKYLQTHQVFKPDYVMRSMGELIGFLDNMKPRRSSSDGAIRGIRGTAARARRHQGGRAAEPRHDAEHSAAMAGKAFADFGAEVIKVEPPRTGAQERALGPFHDEMPDPETGGVHLYLNTNKLGVTLDLKSRGRDLLFELLESADIVLNPNLPEENEPRNRLAHAGRAISAPDRRVAHHLRRRFEISRCARRRLSPRR